MKNIKSTYVSEIIEALKELGGTAKLSEINDCIEKRGKLEYIKSNSNWRDAVRTAIQTHCSKTKSYVEGNEDLFYPVEGLGKGIWGLVDNNPDSNPNNSDILKSHDEWFPSLDEYSSGITTEKWIELLNDKNVFNDKSLKVMKRFLDFGGQATCEELSEKYGNTPGFYSMTSINTIKKVLTVTNCPIMPRNEENSRYWPVFYRGKKAEKNQSGKYIWKLRDELQTALSLVDLSDIDLFEEDNNENDPVIWKISHGTNARGVSEHFRKPFEERRIVVVNRGTSPLAGQKVSQGETYMTEIKAGDYFYLCYAGEIVLFGKFTENTPSLNYDLLQERDDDDWYERKYQLIANSKDRTPYKGRKKWWTSNFNSTCVKVTDNKLFEELILTPYFDLTLDDLDSNEVEIADKIKYTDSDFLNDVFISEGEYTKLKNLLLRKKNIILQGAPGVGKTYVSKRLAYALMGEKDDSRIEFVQFHQNYSYEDFIMGYRPNGDGFELTTGIFYDFCKKAEDDSERDYFFIIDEINRGNLSKIFGELLMLIETDKRKSSGYSASLAYNKQPFSVPDNLHIIGMMNTADRSLAMIDYALRRRFSFYEMKPAFDSENFDIFSASVDSVLFDKTVDAVKQLNKAISSDSSLGKGFEIGHSYFCSANPENITDEYIKSVVEYEIIPTLEEYWFDDADNLKKWKKVLYQAIGADYDE